MLSYNALKQYTNIGYIHIHNKTTITNSVNNINVDYTNTNKFALYR